jgi:hypothetical protein
MENKEVQSKDLLYYLNSKVMTKPFRGKPVIFFNFCSIKTGEIISLGVCIYNDEMEQITGQKYYRNIISAIEYYNILWDVTINGIKRLLEPFENVQNEYFKMLDEGVKENDADNFLVEEYSIKKSNSRCLQRH